MSGALEGIFLNHTNNGTYQCFVKNDFGEDFSRKIKVLVTGRVCFTFKVRLTSYRSLEAHRRRRTEPGSGFEPGLVP